MMTIANPKTWANIVKPGMIVRTESGERVEVYQVIEGYSTIGLSNGIQTPVIIDWAAKVEVLGHFNI